MQECSARAWQWLRLLKFQNVGCCDREHVLWSFQCLSLLFASVKNSKRLQGSHVRYHIQYSRSHVRIRRWQIGRRIKFELLVDVEVLLLEFQVFHEAPAEIPGMHLKQHRKLVNVYVRTRVSIMGQRISHLEAHLCAVCDHVIRAVKLQHSSLSEIYDCLMLLPQKPFHAFVLDSVMRFYAFGVHFMGFVEHFNVFIPFVFSVIILHSWAAIVG